MRRIVIYMSTFLLLVGCKSAAKRGYEKGCDKGTLEGQAQGQADLRSCADPQPVASGCNVAGKGLFRKEKFDDAHDAAYFECYASAYDLEYTEADFNACHVDTGHTAVVDTGIGD